MSTSYPVKHLTDFLNHSHSPFQAADYAEDVFKQAGFTALDYKERWQLQPGHGYYCRTFSGQLFAFKLGKQTDLRKGIHIAAGHIDWPCLRIKPNPTANQQGYLCANVEVYGGPILNTFLDRPLSIAGKIALKSPNLLTPEIRCIDLKKPVCIIPNLAIHMNRDVNDGVALDRQTHLMPVIGMAADLLNKDDCLLHYIAEHEQVNPSDILDYELSLYNLDTPAFVGLHDEFISSPRLDDITSISAMVHGLIEANNSDTLAICALFDSEEIGSRTKEGADSAMLNRILERIWDAFGKTPVECAADIHGSLALSMDVGHGHHPNYPEKSDVTTKPVLGKGFLIKSDCQQRYAWDCEAIGGLMQLCEHFQIPYQRFAKRSNITGGGTISSMMSAQVLFKTVDIGVALLSMHSSRELMAAADQDALENAVKYFFSV